MCVLILCDVVFQQESEATSCSCAMRVQRRRRHLSLFGSDRRTASSLSLRTHRSFRTVLVQFFYVSVNSVGKSERLMQAERCGIDTADKPLEERGQINYTCDREKEKKSVKES